MVKKCTKNCISHDNCANKAELKLGSYEWVTKENLKVNDVPLKNKVTAEDLNYLNENIVSLNKKIGDLDKLITKNKNSLVEAINEIRNDI